MELELQNTTDINGKDIIHKEPIFKEKNTLLFQDVLTNYTYKTYQGFPTTTGNDILISTNSISYNDGIAQCTLLTVDDNTFKADSLVSYDLDSQGDIIDTTSTYSGCLVTVVNDPEGNYRVQLNGRTVTKCNYPFAIIKQTQQTDEIKIIEAHNVDNKLIANILNLNLVECRLTETTTKELPYNTDLCFCTNNAYCYDNTLLIGSDWEDQTKSGTYIINDTLCCYLPFMGRISLPTQDNSLYIFGEPFPNIDTYVICPNKEIRFEIAPTPAICSTCNCVLTIRNWCYYSSCATRINEFYSPVEYTEPVSLIYAYKISSTGTIERCMIQPHNVIDHCEDLKFRCCLGCDCYTTGMSFNETTCRLFINPNVKAAPGDSWLPNCFLSCIITNIACNRNKSYSYNKYGTQILFNERLLTNLVVAAHCSCTCDIVYCFNGAYESKYYCLYLDVSEKCCCSAAEGMTNFGWNVFDCANTTLNSCALNESYPVIAGLSSGQLPTTEYTYCDELKFIRTTCSVAATKVWPIIQHTYDWNLGDLNTSYNYNGIKYHTYHGLGLGYSLNGVLLNNINFLGNAIDIVKNDKCISIATGNTVYRYSTEVPLSIHKLSDFNFETNAVVLNNLIREDRTTGSLSVLPSSLALIPEYTINVETLPVFAQPNLGNSANDTLFVNYGYNVNMESKYATTSVLLPSFQLGMYIPSDAGSAINQTMFGTLNTIVTPIIDVQYPICIYATHTLCSTSVDYLYTCKYCNVCIDPDMIDNNWWTDACTNYFPVALNTPVSNVNGLSSSICLNQDYSASFATCDNTMMTVYNNSKQVYRSSSLFTIYGSQYYYDGQAIYYLGNDGTNQLAAYALGLKYLAASSNEAFFFSDADRNIYSFSGSNTINKSIEAAAVGNVVDAMYDSSSQLLWVLFTDGLYVKSTTSEESSFFNDIKGNKLLSNVKGITIIRDNEANITLSITAFDNILPLDLESEWIGMNDIGYKIPYFDILIYNDNKPHDIEITCSTLSNGKIQEDKRNIHISVSDFAKSTFYRCRVTPVDNNGNAAKIKIYSKDKVSIQGIVIEAVEQAVGAPNV